MIEMVVEKFSIDYEVSPHTIPARKCSRASLMVLDLLTSEQLVAQRIAPPTLLPSCHTVSTAPRHHEQMTGS